MGSLFFKKYHALGCLSALLFFVTASSVSAQTANLDLQLEINESLANSQSINLSELVTNRGQGPNLFTFFLRNNEQEPAESLYLNILLRSDKNGKIGEVYQKQGQPFSLKGSQVVRATNNTIDKGLQGIDEKISFDGGLTTEGEEFINDLEGSTRLPPDRYVIEIDIFQGSNGPNGGELVASSQAEVGANIVDEIRDIYLTSPGAELGSEMEISNSYPEFRWEGSSGVQYRLIVVEASGEESAESLLQSGLSTEPILKNGAAGSGSLLDFEMVDVRLRRTSFQYPPSGVQNLQQGSQYFWQVFAEIKTSNGTETRSSEIWSFVLANPDESEDGQVLTAEGELGQVLREMLGEGQFRQLLRDGVELGSIEIDGEIITGPIILQRLQEFKNRIEEGEITTIDN